MNKKSILVVDDTPEEIDILAGLLSNSYKVLAATNGETALHIAKSSQPDLILLDIVMPGMDGIEVCRRLKEDENTVDIPLIFLSAKADGEDCEHGMELGGDAYLKKPVDAQSLFSVMEIVLPASKEK